MKIIFIGEKPEGTAPTLTWAKALARVGVEFTYVDFSEITTIDWIKEVLKADVIISQWFGIIPKYEMRQLSIAVALGCPIIRKWSGSDIYFALNDAAIKASTIAFDQIVSLNLTSEHNGIVEELESIGLSAQLTDQIINNMPIAQSSHLKKAVLAYLPDARPEFYGFSYIESLVKNYPETEFVIVADKTHKLAHFSNVNSVGWVDDMEPIWERIGLLIRVTEHDGFPRSVVEALARQKYVIHNRQFEGCWYANNQTTIDSCFESFLQVKKVNDSAKGFIENLTSDKPVYQLVDIVTQLKTSFFIRLKSMLYSIKLSF